MQWLQHPVEGALHLAVSFGLAGLCSGNVFAKHLGNVAILVFVTACAEHDVCVLQAHLATGCQAEEALGSILHKVVALYPKLAAELYCV